MNLSPPNFGIIFATAFLLHINLAKIHVLGEETSMEVGFLAEYGGLTGKIAFGKNNWFANVMLATQNSRTFLVNGGTPFGCNYYNRFCQEHLTRYNPASAGTTSQISPLVGNLAGKGLAVEDNILFSIYTDRPLMQKIGLMNELVENDPNFWGNVREAKPPKINLAAGCLSLMLGIPPENFGAKTPLQNFVDQFPDQSFISIRLDKFNESNPEYYFPQSPLPGTLSIGSMTSGNRKCMENGNEWRNVKEKDHFLHWSLQIDGMQVDGIEGAKKAMALIDSNNENILMPEKAWTAVKDKFVLNEGLCNWELPPIELDINGAFYSVPPQHYLRKESESSNNCVLLLGPNLEDEFRLGLPFLRSTCVALDLRTKQVWLSGGQPHSVNGGIVPIPSMAIKIAAFFAIFLQIFALKIFL